MSTRRFVLGLLASFPLLTGTAASAANPIAYTPAAFEVAQKAGKLVLVHITAPWCTTCAAQKPILAQLEAQPRFKDLQVFEVDFDSRKDVVRRFGATMQSTLIVYKGDKEAGRSSGETRPEAIRALLNKGI
ncbi:MAG: thioredoxin family protein [Methylorubrum extorquens]|jgi:thioredoxin 1|uniref:Thioredoxin-related n=2 Tax=Methylorubrum extorquens TaxID=408 RepID=C7CEW5_METED|nr:thioredoxin family protein [Methylorubrum extorquens]EHP93474.1 Thioredoxin domain-containing protein [Methylorubrum extorquens DSM 13060]MCG5248746.1 thioredoxin family protein [Methylorubrum extorquens]CAX22857.1 Thioredoxin-related [Methylorubrum extorquens DM4]